MRQAQPVARVEARRREDPSEYLFRGAPEPYTRRTGNVYSAAVRAIDGDHFATGKARKPDDDSSARW